MAPGWLPQTSTTESMANGYLGQIPVGGEVENPQWPKSWCCEILSQNKHSSIEERTRHAKGKKAQTHQKNPQHKLLYRSCQRVPVQVLLRYPRVQHK